VAAVARARGVKRQSIQNRIETILNDVGKKDRA
jgi:hypothetical protein